MTRRPARAASPPSGLPGALRCRRKFLRQFPGGFHDATYLDWERDYKWETHLRWRQALPRSVFGQLLRKGDFAEAALRAVRVEQRSRHAMLFSFEKMALRDALREPAGARTFAERLYDFLHGRGGLRARFERDNIVPKQNIGLAEEITSNGGLLSEFPLGCPPFSGNFVTRDATQAAISTAVVLVQSDKKGGVCTLRVPPLSSAER